VNRCSFSSICHITQRTNGCQRSECHCLIRHIANSFCRVVGAWRRHRGQFPLVLLLNLAEAFEVLRSEDHRRQGYWCLNLKSKTHWIPNYQGYIGPVLIKMAELSMNSPPDPGSCLVMVGHFLVQDVIHAGSAGHIEFDVSTEERTSVINLSWRWSSFEHGMIRCESNIILLRVF